MDGWGFTLRERVPQTRRSWVRMPCLCRFGGVKSEMGVWYRKKMMGGDAMRQITSLLDEV